MIRTLSRVLLVAATLAFSACSLTPETINRDRLGVQAATMALIERSDDHVAKAERVLAAVEKARTLLEFTDVSVSDLRVALLARVAERDLSPLEKLAALEVINAVADEVEFRLGKAMLTPDQRVTVNTVLSWVEGAARLYVPK